MMYHTALPLPAPLRRVLLASLLSTTILLAQSEPAKPEQPAAPAPAADDADAPEFRISSDVELVLLDVSVKKEDGGFASGLTKEQFQVLENGKPQEIRIFTAQDIPVTVGLVVDNSASMRNKRTETVTAALTFAQESHPQDEIFVINFNDTVRIGLPDGMTFTDDIPTIRAALVGNPVEGRTALYDALAQSLKHLDDGRRDKKTLVLISDGGDNASSIDKETILQMAKQSLATIYAVGIYDPLAKDKDPGFLKEIAKITGGEVFFPNRPEQLVEVCRSIAKDIRNRYTLAYAPADRHYDGKVRKLQVTATAPELGKLKVRTRTGYLAFQKP